MVLLQVRPEPRVGQERPRVDRQAEQVDGVLLVELRVKIVLLLGLGELLQQVVLPLRRLVPRRVLAAPALRCWGGVLTTNVRAKLME